MSINDVLNAGIRTTRKQLGLPALAPENTPPNDDLKRIPVLRRFILDRPGTNASSVNQFYNDYDHAEALHSAWRTLLHNGDVAGAAQYFNDHRAEILSVVTASENGTAGRLAELHKAIAAESKQLNDVRNSNALTPARKATLAAMLENRMVDLARLHTYPTSGARP